MSRHAPTAMPMRIARHAVGLFVLLALLPALGCRTPPQYTIDDRPTLILVDDPHLQLGDPALANLVANQIATELYHAPKKREALTQTVSLQKLEKLRADKGDDFPKMPLDEVGRAVGAQQVLHVYLEAVRFSRAPGLVQPRARVRVKLFDVVEGKRLFPPPPADSAPAHDPSQRSVDLVVETPDPEAVELNPQVRQELARQLAERIGREVSWLFRTHRKDDTDPF